MKAHGSKGVLGQKGAPATPLLLAMAMAWMALGAFSSSAGAACPNESFRVGVAANLPNCRAYEQASPVEKGGLNANSEKAAIQAASDGSSISFYVEAGMQTSEGAQDFGVFLSSRGSDNWSTHGLLPPAELGSIAQVLGLTEDGRYSFVASRAAPGATNPVTINMRDNQTGSLLEVVGGLTKQPFGLIAASDDAEVVAIEAKDVLATGGTSNKPNVYVWDRATGSMRLGSVTNAGTPPTNQGSFGGAYKWWSNEPATTSGGASAEFYAQQQHVLSTDGKRLYFTAGQTTVNQSQVQIYMRENPTAAQSAVDGSGKCTEPEKACTIKVSEPNTGVVDPNGAKPAIFLGATPDGSSAYFMTSAKLTANATTGPADEGSDLYRFRPDAPAGERLTDLSVDTNGSDAAGARVKGLLGYTSDGSRVYFAAAGAIPGSGAPPSPCTGTGVFTVGPCNIYMWSQGASTPTFVAQVGQAKPESTDLLNWSPAAKGNAGNPSPQAARVAPEGGALVFTSKLPVTGYNNEGATCAKANPIAGEFGEPGPCSELYRYVPGSASPVCISCSPSGARPLGLGADLNYAGLKPLSTLGVSPVHLRRSMSPDGNRIFFTSSDPLVAADVNGDAGCPIVAEFGANEPQGRCQDVYEWEAAGASTECPSANGEAGCVHLISTGTSSLPSFFADNDESGANVFFFTAQPLVSQDKDGLLDLYDARVNGGLAAQNIPTPVQCDGEGCKPAATSPPSGSPPGSASFSGPGNAKPKQAKKHKKHSKQKKAKHHQRKKHGKKATKRRGRTGR